MRRAGLPPWARSPAARLAPVLLAPALLVGGCHKDESPPEPAAEAPPAPSASEPPPADHLAADELVEGPKLAFGLNLPRGMQVDGAFADVIMASGVFPLHPLVKYFRARLTEGSLREGEESATFEHVHIPGKVSSEYGVRIWFSHGYTRVEVRDTTPKVLPHMPDDAARWRQAGYTPQGRVLDPTHLE